MARFMFCSQFFGLEWNLGFFGLFFPMGGEGSFGRFSFVLEMGFTYCKINVLNCRN